MKDYKKMYLDLLEEVSITYEDLIYNNMQAIINNDPDLCKCQNLAINSLYHVLSYSNILSIKYDDEISEVLKND